MRISDILLLHNRLRAQVSGTPNHEVGHQNCWHLETLITRYCNYGREFAKRAELSDQVRSTELQKKKQLWYPAGEKFAE
jgi:hypothetical protein